MQLIDLQNRVRIALTTTIVDEWSLLSSATGTTRPSERAVAFHLGWRLRSLVEQRWDVDCEYNRSGMFLEESVRLVDSDGRRIPDVIVHRRGRLGPENNLLLLELATDRVRSEDPEEAFAQDAARAGALQARFGYRYSAVLDLGIGTGTPGSPELYPRWQWATLDDGLEEAEDVYGASVLHEITLRATAASRARER